MKTRTAAILFLLYSLSGWAQKGKAAKETYGIKFDPSGYSKSCIKCLNAMSSMPADVNFGFIRQENLVLFCMSDVDWFNQMFDSKDDGIAVDVIRRDQFACGRNNDYDKNNFVKGTMLKPVFLKDIRKYSVSIPGMEVVVPIAELPAPLATEKDLEFNLMIIKDDRLCHYMAFYDLQGSKLNLLQMDLYMDTLANNKNSGEQITVHRKLEFIIPFDKNKYEYKPQDLKPVSDSLKLNFYNIKNLSLRAYSSVEGSEEKNMELQKKRSESIISSLQSYQNIKIVDDVSTSENWVEFLNDIVGTKYASMKLLSKEEIKAELEKKNVAEELEPILRRHRKAILFLELEKKSKYKDASEEEIKKHFAEAVNNKNINTAWEIQQAIFQNIDSKVYSSNLVKDLEIPEKAEFGSLLINNLVFSTTQEYNELSTLTEFQRLNELIPNNQFIRYNMCVLELKLFSQNELAFNRTTMLQHIQALEKLPLDKRLIRRLTVNYHLILAEYLLREKKYAEKDKSLSYIFANYKSTNYKDEDLLRLSQYFSAFRKIDWALKIIEPRANKIDVTEDLLYYYINLTIIDKKYTAKDSYRSILLNAYNVDPERFCAMFGTAYQGGISFQLLDDLYLKKNYCESCKNTNKMKKI